MGGGVRSIQVFFKVFLTLQSPLLAVSLNFSVSFAFLSSIFIHSIAVVFLVFCNLLFLFGNLLSCILTMCPVHFILLLTAILCLLILFIYCVFYMLHCNIMFIYYVYLLLHCYIVFIYYVYLLLHCYLMLVYCV